MVHFLPATLAAAPSARDYVTRYPPLNVKLSGLEITLAASLVINSIRNVMSESFISWVIRGMLMPFIVKLLK